MPPRPSSRSSSYLVAFVLVLVSMPVSVSMSVVALLVAVCVPLAVCVPRRRGGHGGCRRRSRCWSRRRAGRGVRLDRRNAREQLGAQPDGHPSRRDERVRLRGERGDVALCCAAV